MPSAPIVFVHGMFMTSLCWEHWRARFEAADRVVSAPEWPRREASVEELRAKHPDPSLGSLCLTDVLDSYAEVISKMSDPPVIIGHSMGGLVAQLLLARGLGVAGVAIDTAPPQAVFTAEWSFLKSNWPMITPFHDKHDPRMIPFEDFAYAFGNTLGESEARAFYDRYAVPESRQVPEQSLTHVAHIDFAAPHPPLLLIAGGSDHIIPPGLNKTNAEKYRDASSVVHFREFEGRDHLTIVEAGWEEVADYVAMWLDDQGV
jgi:pimeloyl-ACP methyl ester carboxylesterase